MNFLYRNTAAALAMIAVTGAACAQGTKVKTITIVNGDTTISEKTVGDKDMTDIEKQITTIINENGDSTGKKVVKKIIINRDNDLKDDGDVMTYAYSIGNEKDEDMEITTNSDGKETKIIIKKGDDEKNTASEKKTVTRNETHSSTSSGGKEHLDVSISVNNKVAKINVESGSTSPMNISVLDENGKQVFYDTQAAGGKYSKEITLGKKGTYFLNLIQDKKSTADQIVIE